MTNNNTNPTIQLTNRPIRNRAATTKTTFYLDRITRPLSNSICFWNCNSLNEHIDNIRILLDSSTDGRPAVLALAETRVNPNNIDILPTIQHYTQLHKPHTSRCGGLAVLVHESVAAREIDSSYPHPALTTINQPASSIAAINDDSDSTDIYWVELRFNDMSTPMLLGVVYMRPPVSTAAIERLTDNIDMVRNNTTNPVLIVGDMNLSHPVWDNEAQFIGATPSPTARWLIDYLTDNQLIVLNDGSPTNIAGSAASDPTNSTRSTIDLAITADSDQHLFTFVSATDGFGLTTNDATHIPITIAVTIDIANNSLRYSSHASASVQPRPHVAKLMWRVSSSTPADQWLVFRDAITLQLADQFPFDEIETALNPTHTHEYNNLSTRQHQRNMDRWNRSLLYCFHSAADAAFGRRTGNSRFNHWFMLAGVREAYQHMHDMHTQWQLQYTDAAYQLFAAARESWQSIKADAKLEAWKSFAGELQTDPQAQIRWSVFHQSMHKPYTTLTSFPSPDDGSLPETKIEAFNNLAQAYIATAEPTNPLPVHIKQQVDQLLASKPTSHIDVSDSWKFTADDVKQQCTYQHTTTASGADGIEALFLKRGGDELYRTLALLYSYSWQYSVLPQSWKEANVCSVYKGAGPKHSATSYRPISVTSIIIRTMEHMIHHRLSARLKAAGYFDHNQFGFRHHRSTLDAIHCHLSKLKRYMRNNKSIAIPVVYLDLKKAFDRVSIPRLLYILSQ